MGRDSSRMIGIPTPTCDPSLSTADATCTGLAGFADLVGDAECDEVAEVEDPDAGWLFGADVAGAVAGVVPAAAGCLVFDESLRVSATTMPATRMTATAAASGAIQRIGLRRRARCRRGDRWSGSRIGGGTWRLGKLAWAFASNASRSNRARSLSS